MRCGLDAAPSWVLGNLCVGLCADARRRAPSWGEGQAACIVLLSSPWGPAAPRLTLLLSVILIFVDECVAHLITGNVSVLLLCHLCPSPDSNLTLFFWIMFCWKLKLSVTGPEPAVS